MRLNFVIQDLDVGFCAAATKYFGMLKPLKNNQLVHAATVRVKNTAWDFTNAGEWSIPTHTLDGKDTIEAVEARAAKALK